MLGRSPSSSSITDTTLGLGCIGKRIAVSVAVGDAAERAGDIRHAVAEILAAMRGDEDQRACRRSARRSRPGRPPAHGIGCDAGAGGVERVDHGVAGDVDRRGIDVLAAQRLGGGFGGREMLVGDRGDDAAVHFLGPGLVDVARTQPGLDMADRRLAVIGGERADHGRGGVALDDHPVGAFARPSPCRGRSAGGR